MPGKFGNAIINIWVETMNTKKCHFHAFRPDKAVNIMKEHFRMEVAKSQDMGAVA